MTSIWNAKNNFLLSHFVSLHQQQSSSSLSLIDWPSIVHDLRLEISSTPHQLKQQYDHLLSTVHQTSDAQSLHSIIKQFYLHTLCQRIEDDLRWTLESAYEIMRHIRAKRILIDDIDQLLHQWNFEFSSSNQKINKERLFDILHRFRIYIIAPDDYQPVHFYLPESSMVVIDEPELDTYFSPEVKQPTTTNIDNSEKCSRSRRRSQSLTTLIANNNENQISIGVEWFVPKLKHQQRSISLRVRRSSSPINERSSKRTNLLIEPDTKMNRSSNELSNSENVRRTRTQPVICWLPLTLKQIAEKEHRQLFSSKNSNSHKRQRIRQ